MIDSVVRGASAPEAYRVRFTSPPVVDGGLDLTTVTSVTWLYTRPRGLGTGTWTATIEPGATETALSSIHVWAADGSDVPLVGAIHIRPRLFVGSTEYRAKSFNLYVEED